MKNFTFWGRLLILLIAVVAMDACQSPVIQDEDLGTDVALKSASIAKQSYIVQLNDPALVSELSTVKGYQVREDKVKGKALGLLKQQGISDAELGFVYSNSIIGFSVKMAPGQLKKLQAAGTVKSIHEDKVITLAPPAGKRPSTSSTPPAQVVPWGIARVGGPVDVTNKRAWIIDTGIDLNHEDLNVDTSLGFSAFTTKKDAGFDDGNGHGTHVSGIIAAKDNSIGVVGVAAGATVIPVKVLNSRGSGSYSGVIAGVDWVAASGHGAPGDVANMSLGGPVSQDLDDAVVNAAQSSGVIFVLAAGNESDDANNHSPARANGTNVITVSAMDSSDSFAYFSNYGNPPIDYCAPGVSIYSTYKGDSYQTLSGTSMAAPHVAGIALLGIHTDGYVLDDPDGNADPIAHL